MGLRFYHVVVRARFARATGRAAVSIERIARFDRQSCVGWNDGIDAAHLRTYACNR
jgi:hypothetical protein